MSQWGVFHDDDGYVHVAPVLPDGRLAVKHSLHEFCPCAPKPEKIMISGDSQIWVHQDPEAGGFNS